ncbi:hypothetical protein [Sphingobium yanoikuyae]|uniref:hypothetical protein n=1 Tax=Sphingobium yanoikuyae TaxID=13690 RepID=UPI0028A9C499|nr:hypothetical protein [Sphingobium yanoikuyae]
MSSAGAAAIFALLTLPVAFLALPVLPVSVLVVLSVADAVDLSALPSAASPKATDALIRSSASLPDADSEFPSPYTFIVLAPQAEDQSWKMAAKLSSLDILGGPILLCNVD